MDVHGDVGDVSVAKTAVSVFFIVTVPVLIGLLVRRFAPGFATEFEPWASRISTALFVIVLIGAIVQQRDNIVPYFAEAGLVTLVLNVVMMALHSVGMTASWWDRRRSPRDRCT